MRRSQLSDICPKWWYYQCWACPINVEQLFTWNKAKDTFLFSNQIFKAGCPHCYWQVIRLDLCDHTTQTFLNELPCWWWHSFPMRKQEKWSIISPPKQSRCEMYVAFPGIWQCCWSHGFSTALFSLWIWCRFVPHVAGNLSSQIIRTETHR